MYFAVNIAKFLRTAFFIEHLCWLLQNVLEKLFTYRLCIYKLCLKF